MSMKAQLVKSTVFIAAPVEARKDIKGGCQCPYCLAHPDKTPQWDTIAVDAQAPDWAVFVHMPELEAEARLPELTAA